jgi:hypothetical protein
VNTVMNACVPYMADNFMTAEGLSAAVEDLCSVDLFSH